MDEFKVKDRYGWEDLLAVMRLLRSPGGCPWDGAQTHQSIRRNFLEETYEALDAIDRDDAPAMREELGDVLLQVVFHAAMEEEAGRFTAEDVIDTVTKKLVFRHPHIFGDGASARDSAQALENWEARKRREKGFVSTADAIEAVPHTLPALWRAEKINKKTIRAGFSWNSPEGALLKLEEETAELRSAVEAGADPAAPHGIREELGDALFILSKIAQMTGVDPEEALHLACDKFDRRFRKVEVMAECPLDSLSQEELISLWNRAKALEPRKTTDEKEGQHAP